MPSCFHQAQPASDRYQTGMAITTVIWHTSHPSSHTNVLIHLQNVMSQGR